MIFKEGIEDRVNGVTDPRRREFLRRVLNVPRAALFAGLLQEPLLPDYIRHTPEGDFNGASGVNSQTFLRYRLYPDRRYLVNAGQVGLIIQTNSGEKSYDFSARSWAAGNQSSILGITVRDYTEFILVYPYATNPLFQMRSHIEMQKARGGDEETRFLDTKYAILEEARKTPIRQTCYTGECFHFVGHMVGVSKELGARILWQQEGLFSEPTVPFEWRSHKIPHTEEFQRMNTRGSMEFEAIMPKGNYKVMIALGTLNIEGREFFSERSYDGSRLNIVIAFTRRGFNLIRRYQEGVDFYQTNYLNERGDLDTVSDDTLRQDALAVARHIRESVKLPGRTMTVTTARVDWFADGTKDVTVWDIQ